MIEKTFYNLYSNDYLMIQALSIYTDCQKKRFELALI